MIIEYFVTATVLYAGFILIVSPIIGFMTYLASLPDDAPLHFLNIPVTVLVLGVVLIVVPYLTHQVAKRRVYESLTFRQSFAGALVDARIKLSFLPLIGGLFMPKEQSQTEEDQSAQP